VKSLATATIVLAATVVAPSARADAAEGALESEPSVGRVDHRESMTRLELGYRGSFVPDSGFDPFSTTSYLPQLSITASRTIFAYGRWSFAPGVSWDHAGSSATARGDGTSLTVNRLTVPLEGRVHLGACGYAFARLAPGLSAQAVQIEEASSPALLSKSRWLFATDASAGYAWLVSPRGHAFALVPRMWLQGDVGYGWTFAEGLDLSPDLPSGSPDRASGVNLGSLVLRGAFFRIAAAASF
jgi:hypothetical protein